MFQDLRADRLRPAPGSIEAPLDDASAIQDGGRAKRQLEALVAFVKGQNTFPATNGEVLSAESPGTHFHTFDGLNIEQLSVLDTGIWRPKTPPCGQSVYPSPSVSPRQGSESSSSSETHQQHVGECSARADHFVLVPESPSISQKASLIYSQASSLLLAGMDIDGALFLDAPRGNSRLNSRRSSYAGQYELNIRPEHARFRRRNSSLSSEGEWYEKPCEVLGSSFSERYHTNSHRKPSYTLTQGFLQDLFTSFPQGKIFNPVKTAQEEDPIHQILVDGLVQKFPDATSILFLPFWDWDKSRWIAAAVTWACDSHFAEHDLHYLRAFSDTMVSGLAQIDRMTIEKSKHDLLSSVSHELRSPLHGILANSELLQSTFLEPAQREMLDMIKTCGHTLLDTMNHLLDFAKINNLTNLNKLSANNAVADLTSNFDLDTLVEDVTDSLYAGHRWRKDSSKVTGRYPAASNRASYKSADGEGNMLCMEDLFVVTRIEDRDTWKIQSMSGAWRRIIINVLGNAFKFTRSGVIEVSLAQTQIRHNESKSDYAHIHVTDTGSGISQDYLRKRIFSPFSQERIITEGVGLGLNLSHQLITHLGGQIDIKSEVGVGTRVEIRVPVQFVEKEQVKCERHTNDHRQPWATKRVCLVDLNPYMGNKEQKDPLSRPEAKRKLAIQGAMSNILMRQRGWKISLADSLEHGSGDIAVLEESTLVKLTTSGPVKTAFPSVIVIQKHGSSAPADLTFEDAVNVVYIPQPLGPRRIIQALQRLGVPHPRAGSDALSLGSLPDDSMRRNSMSAVFGVDRGLDSPPLVRASVSEYTARAAQSPERGLHVLIVDDNDINLKVLSTFMQKIGCTYDTASNGLAAVEKYKQSQPRFDYVLMDISMPIMNGITASSHIREYEDEGSLRRSTIMAVTGVASSEMQEEAFAAGIDDYLVKPLSLHDLKRIMRIP